MKLSLCFFMTSAADMPGNENEFKSDHAFDLYKSTVEILHVG